jgi:membrane protease YdiL (CAAX protease family)
MKTAIFRKPKNILSSLIVLICVVTVTLMARIPLTLSVFGIRAVYFPLLVFFLVMLAINLISKKDFSYLRFDTEAFRLNLIYFFPFILIMLLMLVFGFYPQQDLSHLNRGIPYPEFILLYSLISVPVQQILIFGEVLRSNQNIFTNKVSILLTALFYSLIHIYYPQGQIILISTFIFGLIWAYITIKTKSVFANILFHIVVGLFAFSLQLA